ncbi:phage integrase [hydrocarbon metagenome]|uniref:Phage integrase n=1 Tax=hydrocarbon metagenome TaxID=938273 RepID=A0A0W8FYZ0_9ZZZZ
MARIFSRGKTLWITYSIHGKQYRESLGLRNTRENLQLAKKLKLQKEADILNGRFPEIKRVKKKSLDVAFSDFIKTKEGRSDRTIEAYQYSFDRLKTYLGGSYEVNRVNDETVKAFEKWLRFTSKKYLNKKKNVESSNEKKVDTELSKNTIEFIFRHVRIFFEYCKKQKYIEINPFPRKEATAKKINIISVEEQEMILEQLRKENKNQYKAINLLIMTGFRSGEALRLKFEDIDFKRNIIYVTNSKGKRTDEFPLYLELREFLLTEWKEEERKGKVLKYKSHDSLRFFEGFLKRNGYKHYTLHELRKSFLTLLANAGLSLFDLQIIARHREVKTTQKYYLKAEMDRIGNRISDVISITKNITPPEKRLKIA